MEYSIIFQKRFWQEEFINTPATFLATTAGQGFQPLRFAYLATVECEF
jgi:hypothetical protein